jgi:hypothetical protein
LSAVGSTKEEDVMNNRDRDHRLTASDLVQAAASVDLVLEQHVADYMIDMVKGNCSYFCGIQSSGKKDDSHQNEGISRADFIAFWAPPDP